VRALLSGPAPLVRMRSIHVPAILIVLAKMRSAEKQEGASVKTGTQGKVVQATCASMSTSVQAIASTEGSVSTTLEKILLVIAWTAPLVRGVSRTWTSVLMTPAMGKGFAWTRARISTCRSMRQSVHATWVLAATTTVITVIEKSRTGMVRPRQRAIGHGGYLEGWFLSSCAWPALPRGKFSGEAWTHLKEQLVQLQV
jgi:hypothetical protein